MRVVGECFFWYRLTRVFPDKFHRAVKRLCVLCVICQLLIFIVPCLKCHIGDKSLLNIVIYTGVHFLSGHSAWWFMMFYWKPRILGFSVEAILMVLCFQYMQSAVWSFLLNHIFMILYRFVHKFIITCIHFVCTVYWCCRSCGIIVLVLHIHCTVLYSNHSVVYSMLWFVTV